MAIIEATLENFDNMINEEMHWLKCCISRVWQSMIWQCKSDDSDVE